MSKDERCGCGEELQPIRLVVEWTDGAVFVYVKDSKRVRFAVCPKCRRVYAFDYVPPSSLY